MSHDRNDVTPLERLLQLEGDFRQRLRPLGVTTSQAGVLLFLLRHVDINVVGVARALGVQHTTMGVILELMVQKGWVVKRRTEPNHRRVYLRLSHRGTQLAAKITERLKDMKSPFTIRKEI